MKELELSKHGKNRGKYFALLDNDIFDIVNEYDWHYSHGYAQNGKLNILLHRYIWTLKVGNIPSGLEVEHINQDKLDCRLENLRLANRSENVCNVTLRKDNTSGYKGISKYVQRDKRHRGWKREYWRVRINKDGKQYTKQFPFTDEGLELAKEWYKNMSLKIHGEFSIFNKDKK